MDGMYGWMDGSRWIDGWDLDGWMDWDLEDGMDLDWMI